MTATRTVRSFVIRAGRLTPAQGRALDTLLPRYALPVAAALAGGARPLHVEIGIGNGEQLLALAASRPDWDFVGCEVHPPGLGHALLGIEARELDNLRLHAGDAVSFVAGMQEGLLDAVSVFFPDPWPKTRHHKRRLLGAEFLALLTRAFKRGGRLYFASDDLEYAAQVQSLLAADERWANLAGPSQYAPRPRWRLLTRFERRAARAGSTIRELAYARVR